MHTAAGEKTTWDALMEEAEFWDLSPRQFKTRTSGPLQLEFDEYDDLTQTLTDDNQFVHLPKHHSNTVHLSSSQPNPPQSSPIQPTPPAQPTSDPPTPTFSAQELPSELPLLPTASHLSTNIS